MASATSLPAFPPELLAHICARLDPRDILTLSRTCRAVRALKLEKLYPHPVEPGWRWHIATSALPFKNYRISVHSWDITEATRGRLLALTPPSAIHLDYGPGSRPDLPFLADLPALTSLNLGFTATTDLDMAGIAPLAGLTSLELYGTRVTDAGMPHLAGLTALTSLNLRYARVTDAGLRCLAGLTTLTSLELAFTGVTNAGMPHLAPLTRLTSLGLVYTGVTREGLPRLAGLASTASLDLWYVVEANAIRRSREPLATPTPPTPYPEEEGDPPPLAGLTALVSPDRRHAAIVVAVLVVLASLILGGPGD